MDGKGMKWYLIFVQILAIPISAGWTPLYMLVIVREYPQNALFQIQEW